MVTPHLTTFDPESAGEMVQGIEFHKQQFDRGILSTSHSACPVWHYVGSPVPLCVRPRPPFPVHVCSMPAGPSAPTPTSIASPPACSVPSAQSVFSGALPAGPATNVKR